MTGPEAARALRHAGWYEHHQTGSHLILRHPDRPGVRVDVPIHKSKPLKLGTLASIIKSAGLTVEEFIEFL